MKLDEKSRKKVLILLIVLLAAMLIPVKIQHKNGITDYQALLYRIRKNNAPQTENYRTGRLVGTEVRILNLSVYDDSEFIPDNIEHVLSPAETYP